MCRILSVYNTYILSVKPDHYLLTKFLQDRSFVTKKHLQNCMNCHIFMVQATQKCFFSIL